MSQLRLRTDNALVHVSITTFDEHGEPSISMRWYGPFETADEQRKFMLSIIDDGPLTEENKERYREVIRAWIRFDEPEGAES